MKYMNSPSADPAASKNMGRVRVWSDKAESSASNLVVRGANTSFNLLAQCGMGLFCTTQIPLTQLLCEELRVPTDILSRVDVLLLDGKPVDKPDKTIVPNRARLALAAGLPGMAGVAMKVNSAVRGLRGGITYCEGGEISNPQPGHIELALYGLAQPLLAAHFLAGGVLLPAGKIVARLAACVDKETLECILEGRAMPPHKAIPLLEALGANEPIFLRLED